MKSYALYFAWLIACVSVLGSLFVSELLHLEPCHLCWYQRICVFPLAIILGIAYYRDFKGIVPYVFPLVVLGFLFAIYQVFLQETGMSLVDMCGAGPSCSHKENIGLGFVSLPMLSALSFFLMGILLLIAKEAPKSERSN